MFISKRMVIAGVLLTLLLSGAAYVLAQDEGMIDACVNPAGSIRILKEGESCLPKESLLSWNKQGPQGEKGDKGDTGEVGPQGPPGVSGYQIVLNTEWTDYSLIGWESGVYADCPDGMKVLGGGGLAGRPGKFWGGWDLNQSYPCSDTRWCVSFRHNLIPEWTVIEITAYAICANVTE